MIQAALLAAAVRILDPSGNAVPGATAVCVEPASEAATSAKCRRIRCEAPGFVPGESAAVSGAASCTLAPGVVVAGEVPAGAAARGLEARLVPKGKDAKPVATLTVPKAQAGAPVSGFAMQAVPPGRYALELARAEDGWVCRADLGPLSAGRQRVAAAWRDPAVVTVRVRDAAGKGAAEIPVTAPSRGAPPAPGTWACGPSTRKPVATDAAGAAKLSLDPAQSALIVAGDWKHPRGLAYAVLDRAPSAPVTLDLALPVRVRAKLMDEKDRAVGCEALLSDLAPDTERLVAELPGASIKGTCEPSGALALGPIVAAPLVVEVRPRPGLPLRVAVDRPAPGATVDLGVLRVKSGESVRVVVADEAGEPVAGASVIARGSSGIVLTVEGKTGEDGGVDLGGLPKGAVVMLMVTAKGFVTATQEGLLLDASPYRVTLSRGGTISGQVVDGDGRGIEGATITLAGDEGGSEAKSEADGAFSVDGLPDGTWRAIASATGYSASDPVAVTVREHRAAADLRLTLSVAEGIGGRVVDSRGAPAAGARVRLIDRNMLGNLEGADPIAEETTGADGAFRLRAAVLPSHVLVATRAGNGPAVDRSPASSSQAGEIVLTLSDPASLVVHVPAGPSSPAVQVHDGAGVGRRVTRTARGDLSFADLAPGNGGAGYAGRQPRAVALTAGRTAEVTLEAGGAVEGRVTFRGTPAARTVVRAVHEGPSRFGPDSGEFTDEGGRYRIDGLAADTYRLIALGEEGRDEATFEVAVGETRHIDLDLHAVRLVMRVVDGADDKPVAGAFVSVVTAGGQCTSMGRTASWGDPGELGFDLAAGANGCQTSSTDASGAARFTLAESGSYDLAVIDRRFEPWQQPAALAEGTAEKRVSLTRKPDTASDKPKVIADLRTDPPGMQGRISCIYGNSTSSSSPVAGRYTCQDMSPGPGEIVFVVEGYGRGRATFTVPETGEIVVPVVVTRGGTLVVPVTREGGQPKLVDGSGVDWTESDARANGSLTELPSVGRAWVYNDMPPGTWTVVVDGKARAPVPLAAGGTAIAY